MKKKIIISMMIACAICLTASAALSDYYIPLLNGGFEAETYAGWTVTNGDGAWGDGPVSNAQLVGIGNWDGLWVAVSGNQGSGGWNENTTGTLQSISFTYPTNGIIYYKHGGWSMEGVGQSSLWNYVTVTGTDGTDHSKIYVPGTGVMQPINYKVPAAYGNECVINCVDNRAGSWGWMCVDSFRIVVDNADAKRDFETSFTNWQGWTTSGTAFGIQPRIQSQHPNVTGISGTFFADSSSGGESAVGELKSDNFTHPDGNIYFIIGGWSRGSPVQDTSFTNYVGLYLASDDSELARVEAPKSDASVVTNIFSDIHWGDPVYLKIVDNDVSNSYAWIYADYFQFDIIPEPAILGLLALLGFGLLRGK